MYNTYTSIYVFDKDGRWCSSQGPTYRAARSKKAATGSLSACWFFLACFCLVLLLVSVVSVWLVSAWFFLLCLSCWFLFPVECRRRCLGRLPSSSSRSLPTWKYVYVWTLRKQCEYSIWILLYYSIINILVSIFINKQNKQHKFI